MSNQHIGALEIQLDAQTATTFRSNACLAHEIIARALIDHDFPKQLVIFTYARELLASADGHEISFHVPLGSTIQEVALPHDIDAGSDGDPFELEADHVHP